MGEHETKVWTYWEGTCPPFIELCLESIRRWCNVRVLDRSTFDDLWQYDRDVAIDELYVSHRADFIRTYLLRHFGGAWIDADCIVLRSLGPLFALRASYDLIYYREPPGGIANNFLVCNAKAAVIKAYYDSVLEYLREGRPMFWSAIGSYLLSSAIERDPERTKIVSTDCIMPISWDNSERFLDVVSDESLQEASRGSGKVHNRDAYCYMLCNHSMPSQIRHMRRDEIFERPILLNYLLRVSEGNWHSAL